MEKQFKSIVLSGTITLCVESDLKTLPNVISMPIEREFFFKDFIQENATILKCTCNSFYFFLLYKTESHLCIDMFGMTKDSKQPKSKHKVTLDFDSINKIKSRDIDLFCSDNYLYCSIKYQNLRYIYFLVIESNGEGSMKLKEIKCDNVNDNNKNDNNENDNNENDETKVHSFAILEILGKAYDFTGNNRNFAFFNFGGFNDGDNQIYTFRLNKQKEWECQKIGLIKPSSEPIFFHQNYIKMVYKSDDLVLIGENQKLVRNIYNLADPNIYYTLKYSSSLTTELIASVFTVIKHDPIRIINKYDPNKKEIIIICDALEFCNDQTIKYIKGYEYDKTKKCIEEDDKTKKCIEYIDDIQLPIKYKNNRREQWIKSKRSCIFYSSAYLEEVETTEPINEEVKTTTPFADFQDFGWDNFDKIGKLGYKKH